MVSTTIVFVDTFFCAYNLNGQCVGTSLSQLKRGIYIPHS